MAIQVPTETSGLSNRPWRIALLVLPWVGFLLDTWLGALIGVGLYLGSRIFAPAEEAALARTFGEAWQAYSQSVKLRWV